MIVFELSCANGHHFDAWFRDGAAYDAQSAGGDIACPFCDDRQVSKAPMAPNIVRSGGRRGESERGESEQRAEAVAQEMMRKLEDLRQHVENTCDYVGTKFSEEARRIFYGEREQRNIYGEASDDEAASLLDEGIEVRRVPWFYRRND